MNSLMVTTPQFTISKETTSLGDGTIREIGQVPVDFTIANVTGIYNKAVAAAVFSGAGLDDMSSGGSYSGPAESAVTYVVEIDGTGIPDTFRWSSDGGATWTVSTVNITGSAQTLEYGITIEFLATTGHTATDTWIFTVATNYVTAYSGAENIQWDENDLDLGERLTTALGGANTVISVSYQTDNVFPQASLPTKNSSAMIQVVIGPLLAKGESNPDVTYEVVSLVGGATLFGVRPNLITSKGFEVNLIVVVTDGTDLDIALYNASTATLANQRWTVTAINGYFNSSVASPALKVPIEDTETIYIGLKDDGTDATPASTFIYLWGKPIV